MIFRDPKCASWAFRATVFPSDKSPGFVGFGDADPSNVSSGCARCRDADGRDPSRQPALRKAYGIGSLLHRGPPERSQFRLRRRSFLPERRMKAATALPRRSAIVCARSSASTSSTPNWSRPTPSISAARRRSEMPAGNKLRTSSYNWPTGPRVTEMVCSASSIPTPTRSRRVSYEPENPRSSRNCPRFSSEDPRRYLSCARQWWPVPLGMPASLSTFSGSW